MIDPQDIDPETGRPYAGYSSPSLDTSFHDHEMEIDEDSIVDWRFEVANGDTRLGFDAWREVQIKQRDSDRAVQS